MKVRVEYAALDNLLMRWNKLEKKKRRSSIDYIESKRSPCYAFVYHRNIFGRAVTTK